MHRPPKRQKRVLVLHRKKNLNGPVAQRLKTGHVKSVGQFRDQNGPNPA